MNIHNNLRNIIYMVQQGDVNNKLRLHGRRPQRQGALWLVTPCLQRSEWSPHDRIKVWIVWTAGWVESVFK